MPNAKSNTADREIAISRKLNAPVDLVWEAWTRPEHIVNWWGPHGFTNTIHKMEVRSGGEWDLVMHGPDGTDYKNKSIFKEVILHKKLVYEHISAPKFIATVEFEAEGDQTHITWRMVFETAEEFIHTVKTFKADEGIKQNVEKLIAYLAGMKAQTGQYAQVNGLHMYYEIHGAGKPLVLVHGAASTIETTFGRLLSALSRDHTIIAVELQAHGHSDNRDGRQITFEQDADDVAALLQQLHIEKADVFGFSNGGTTALQFAIRHPGMVSRLIIASAMYKRAGVAPAFWEGFHHPNFDDLPAANKKDFLAVNPSQEALHLMFDQCVGRMLHFTDIPDPVIAGIQAPALILSGDKDVPLPEHAVEMYHRLPHASLGIFPGGHGAYMGELAASAEGDEPPAALAVILDFLK